MSWARLPPLFRSCEPKHPVGVRGAATCCFSIRSLSDNIGGQAAASCSFRRRRVGCCSGNRDRGLKWDPNVGLYPCGFLPCHIEPRRRLTRRRQWRRRRKGGYGLTLGRRVAHRLQPESTQSYWIVLEYELIRVYFVLLQFILLAQYHFRIFRFIRSNGRCLC